MVSVCHQMSVDDDYVRIFPDPHTFRLAKWTCINHMAFCIETNRSRMQPLNLGQVCLCACVHNVPTPRERKRLVPSVSRSTVVLSQELFIAAPPHPFPPCSCCCLPHQSIKLPPNKNGHPPFPHADRNNNHRPSPLPLAKPMQCTSK